LNEAISTRNPFWASLGILENAIGDMTLHFDLALAHDFRGALKRWRRWSQFLSRELIQQECARLGTTLDHCSVGKLSIFLLPIGRMFLAAIDTQWGPEAGGSSRTGLAVQPSTHAMEYSESVHHRNPQAGWTSEAVE
jgi:hypothetical protein